MSNNNRVEIYHTAQDNPKMKEIYDILLLAGYFRIRIPSISDFDKIVGGLTWCINCSYFEIDINFHDDMKLGEKIKLCEKVCNVLKLMECPYPLQPFQIQGLDSNSLFPVIQWLIKFVYQTRELRQAFNENMTYFLAKKSYKAIQNKENQKQTQLKDLQSFYLKNQDPRVSKNSKIKKTAKKDPLRVYSALIEYGDVTAYKTYNKLCGIMSGKINVDEKANNKLSKKVTQFEQQQGQQSAKKQEQDQNVNQLLFHGSTADEKLQNINSQKQNEEFRVDLPQEIDFALDEEQVKNFKNVENTALGKIGDKVVDLIDADEINNAITEQENNKNDENNPLNITKLLANEKQFHEGQVQAMTQQIAKLEKDLEEQSEELYQLQEKEQESQDLLNKHQGLFEELTESQNTLQVQIEDLEKQQKLSQAEKKKAQQLVEKKTELDNKKKMIKKMIKQEQQELNQEREKVENQIPEWENTEQYVQQLYQEVQEKKEKYDEKFKQLALLNQEIAVLQRKLEGVPSPTEIAQYHQRLQELFQNINQENLKYKDKYIQFNGASDVKDMLAQFVEIMRTFKENFSLNRKSKSGRENFISELGDTRKAMLGNLEKSKQFLQNQQKSREQKYQSLNLNQQQEREYYQLLKQLRIEFEKGDEIHEQIIRAQQQSQY